MRAIIVLLLSLLVSCKKNSPDITRVRQIPLEHKAGTLFITLPAKFDTTYKWVNYSDTDCSDKFQIRWADSHTTLHKESGFFYPNKRITDTLCQFTISQYYYRECLPGWDEEREYTETDLACFAQARMEMHPHDKLVRKEIKKINNHTYMIIAVVATGRQENHVYLKALTYTHNYPIDLLFESSARDSTGFLSEAYRALLTTRFSPD